MQFTGVEGGKGGQRPSGLASESTSWGFQSLADILGKTPSIYLIWHCSSQILTNSLFPLPISISNKKYFLKN